MLWLGLLEIADARKMEERRTKRSFKHARFEMNGLGIYEGQGGVWDEV